MLELQRTIKDRNSFDVRGSIAEKVITTGKLDHSHDTK